MTNQNPHLRLAAWRSLLNEVAGVSRRQGSAIHGEAHWLAVAATGLTIAGQFDDACPRIAVAFGMIHDCLRQNDHHDPDHGSRAAMLVRSSAAATALFEEEEVEVLARACIEHDRGGLSADPRIATCFDADRFNLVRIGLAPDRRYFSHPWSRHHFDQMVAWADLVSRWPPDWETIFVSLPGG